MIETRRCDSIAGRDHGSQKNVQPPNACHKMHADPLRIAQQLRPYAIINLGYFLSSTVIRISVPLQRISGTYIACPITGNA